MGSNHPIPGTSAADQSPGHQGPGPKAIAQLLPDDTARSMALSNYVYSNGAWRLSWSAVFRGPYIRAQRSLTRQIPLDFEENEDE